MEEELQNQQLTEVIDHQFVNLPYNFEIDVDDCFFLQFKNEAELPHNIDHPLKKIKNIIIIFTQKSDLLFDGLEKFVQKLLKSKIKIEYLEINVKKLEKWHKLEQSDVTRLCQIVQQLNQVKYLYLYFDGVSDEYSTTIINSIINVATVQRNLEMLHIELSSLAQRGAGEGSSEKLAEMIQTQKDLKHLSLNLHNWGTEPEFQHPNQEDLLLIIKQLPKLENLQSLYLCCGGWKSWGSVRDVHMQQYMNELKKMKPLTALLLDFRGWGSTITNHWEEVFTNQAAIYFEEFLSTQSQLKWLNLKLLGWGDNNQFFTTPGIMSIGNGLKHLENLQYLYLDLKKPPSSRDFQNKYSAHSLVYLIAQMRKMKKLTDFRISLPDKCMIPNVKRILNHLTQLVLSRKYVIKVLRDMNQNTNMAQLYRKEIIQGVIVTMFGGTSKF